LDQRGKDVAQTNAQLQSQAQTFQSESQKQLASIQATQAELDRVQQANLQLRTENPALKQQIKDLTTKLQVQKSTYDAQLLQKDADAKVLQSQIQQLQTQIQQLQSQIQQLQSQIQQLQTEKQTIDGVTRPSRCLADFVAPHHGLASDVADYVGVFAVTAGLGSEKKEAQFTAAHDDYSAILFKALADRLAEAFAEYLHWRVRTDLWGYAKAEMAQPFSTEDLIAERYQGIRPAPGYPACPDHLVKRELFDLLQCQDIGMGLTDSLAMTPAASVSGFYLAHPDSTYFNVGKIGEDQLHDLAARRGMPVDELRRWLAPVL
jgi:cobalamin-dependent methionine synthase I